MFNINRKAITASIVLVVLAVATTGVALAGPVGGGTICPGC